MCQGLQFNEHVFHALHDQYQDLCDSASSRPKYGTITLAPRRALLGDGGTVALGM